MRMSIEEAIKKLSQSVVVIGCENWIGARDLAIETMRKYQKIEQIVNSNPDYIHPTDMDTYKLNSIREVLEDEKID